MQVVMQSEERRQGRGWSPEMAVDLSLVEQYAGSQTQSGLRLLCQKDKQDKSAALYLLSRALSNRLEFC